MERDERQILDQIRLLGLQVPEEKKDNMLKLIRFYMEALKRCPSVGQIPREELLELIRLLKEFEVL